MAKAKVVEKGRTSDRVAGGIGVAVAAIVAWALGEFAGVEMPEPIIGALGAVLMYAATKIEEAQQ